MCVHMRVCESCAHMCMYIVYLSIQRHTALSTCLIGREKHFISMSISLVWNSMVVFISGTDLITLYITMHMVIYFFRH